MCGIHFVMSSDSYATKADDFVSNSFLANQVRGLHSSGIFQVAKDKKVSWLKSAVAASQFIGDKDVKQLISDTPRSPLTVCHVRHATAGKINTDNAHPFAVTREDGSTLTGVHNGTLRGWRGKHGAAAFDVDSEWAMNMIADEGADAFEMFDGAYAMIWYDSNHPDHVFMCRNEERPLHYMITEDKKTILGASELGMLGWIAERNNFKLSRDKKGGMFYLSPGKLYKFSLKEIGKYEVSNLPKYDAKVGVVAGQSNFQQGSGGSSVGYWDDNGHWQYYGATSYHPAQRSYASSYKAKPYGQDPVLNYIKDALRKTREKEYEAAGKTVIDTDKLPDVTEQGMRDAIDNWERQKAGKQELDMYAPLVSDPRLVTKPKDDSATRGEIEEAKKRNVYGQVVQFTGIMHDADTQTMLGSFEVMEEESGFVRTLDGELRFVSTHLASRYTDIPVLMCIIGYTNGIAGEYPTYIVAPLSKTQKDWIDAELTTERKTALTVVH